MMELSSAVIVKNRPYKTPSVFLCLIQSFQVLVGQLLRIRHTLITQHLSHINLRVQNGEKLFGFV